MFEVQHDFSVLSCLEITNVTIVMDFNSDKDDKLLAHLKKFIVNEKCFIINMYLNNEGRVVQVHKGEDLARIMERNADGYDGSELVN